MSVSRAYMSAYCLHTWCPQRSKEGLRSQSSQEVKWWRQEMARAFLLREESRTSCPTEWLETGEKGGAGKL